MTDENDGHDEFDSALEESVKPEIDIGAEDLLGGDDDDIEASADNGGGGDIDDEQADDSDRRAGRPDHGDPAPAAGSASIDRARNAERQLHEAVDIERQWSDEHARVEGEFKAAQEKFKAVRQKVMADEATDDDELAAQNAVFDARYALDKARDQYGAATQWREQVEQQPKLAPAQAAWLDANGQYSTDTRFQKQAQGIMSDLINDGMDPTHQNFYRQLDERLREPKRMGRGSRRTPGAPAVRSTRSKGTGGGMTKAEQQFIRRLGRDPNDKAVAEQWAKSKENTKRIARDRGQL